MLLPDNTNTAKEQSSDWIVIFTRYPEPGRVKTRLIPALGVEGAARLHREMTTHVIEVSLALCSETTIEVWHDGQDDAGMRRLFGFGFLLRQQSHGNLGQRMHDAFMATFARGARRVVLIGSDCPSIRSDILLKAFDELSSCDCVLGPTYDGGYYLIALKQPSPILFTDVMWGSDHVLEDTIEKAAARRLSTTLLAPLHDIDRPEDLGFL